MGYRTKRWMHAQYGWAHHRYLARPSVCFNYAHLPERFKGQRQINEADLPSPADKLTMLGNTIHALTDAGYQYIGIDHFAKPDDELIIAQNEGKLPQFSKN